MKINSLHYHLCNEETLIKSWNSIKRKKNEDRQKRGKDINGVSLYEFKKDYERKIGKLLVDLINNTYSPSKLKGFYKTKPGSSNKRLIGIPAVDDRILQKSILEIINPIIMPRLKNGVSFGGISGSNKIREDDDWEPVGIKGAMSHFKSSVSEGNFWVFKSDIKSFYDEIPKDLMYERIIELLPDKSINKIIKDIIYFEWGNQEELEFSDSGNEKIGIAQGPPLSPMFSNIYLINFDSKMKDKYGKNYIRYADDFIVLGESEPSVKEAWKTAESYLTKEHLRLSPDENKTLIAFLKRDPLIYLGLRITRQKIISKKMNEIKPKIDTILNEKTDRKSKIVKINNYNRGIFESLKNYHCRSLFEEINFKIKNKKKINKFSALKLLDLSKLDPIVSEEVWQSYFKNTK